MSVAGNKESREAAAEKFGLKAWALAKETYKFIVEYPIDWQTDELNDELIKKLRLSVRDKYPVCLMKQFGD